MPMRRKKFVSRIINGTLSGISHRRVGKRPSKKRMARDVLRGAESALKRRLHQHQGIELKVFRNLGMNP